MAKFSQIKRGSRARKTVLLPLGDGPIPLPTVGADGKVVFPEVPGGVPVDVRVLMPEEQADALARAREYAVGKGIPEPRAGEAVYDLALQVYELALAAIDRDSPVEKPEPFFDGGAEQIFAELDHDRIAYLHARYQVWQDECSPQRLSLTPEEFMTQVLALAVAEDEAPFVQLRPGTQWIVTRTLAALYVSSLTLKSLSTSGSEATGTTSTPALSEGT